MGKWFKLFKKDSICKLKRDTAILNILQIFQSNFKDVINWCFGSDYTIYSGEGGYLVPPLSHFEKLTAYILISNGSSIDEEEGGLGRGGVSSSSKHVSV